jgi:hypothetical protein
MAAFFAGSSMSAASKGREREIFVNDFLKNIMPPIYRFGTGDITDSSGRKSGQVDVVIEYPFGPSLPALGDSQVRLYVAETAAAVIEVKSDLAGQWDEVVATANKVKSLSRNFGATMTMGMAAGPQIPVVAVGFRGWNKLETVQKKLQENPSVDAALVIENRIFAASQPMAGYAVGDGALWSMISYLNMSLTSLQSATYNPFQYL